MSDARYRCTRCDFVTSYWAPAQRHSNESKHGRIEMCPDRVLAGVLPSRYPNRNEEQ